MLRRPHQGVFRGMTNALFMGKYSHLKKEKEWKWQGFETKMETLSAIFVV